MSSCFKVKSAYRLQGNNRVGDLLGLLDECFCQQHNIDHISLLDLLRHVRLGRSLAEERLPLTARVGEGYELGHPARA